jgi:hypothetical protein
VETPEHFLGSRGKVSETARKGRLDPWPAVQDGGMTGERVDAAGLDL